MNTHESIRIESRIVRDAEIIFHSMDDETVMMSLERGEYYSVPPIGTRIWDLLETPQSVLELCDTVLPAYDVTREQGVQDILLFLDELAEKGLIKVITA